METQKEINEAVQELFKKMDSEINEYKKVIDGIDDVTELKEKEQELIKEMEKNDERLKSVRYKLPEMTQFEKSTYTKATVSKYIINQLKKMEVGWQLTLGYHILANIWKSMPSEVDYGTLDSTLRTLQQLKFKGPDDWKSILVINEYFKAVHSEYTSDLAIATALAEKHNAILNRMDLIAKKNSEVDPNEVVQQDMMEQTAAENNK